MASSANAPSGVEQLVNELREEIYAGNFVPRQRLVEADIAEQFRVTRGTVRSAFAELDVEGLIERIPNRGARIRSVSVAEAIEITEVRAALEALCASKAAEAVTDEQIQLLRGIGKNLTTAVQAGDLQEYSDCNRQLHATLIEMSGQRTAAATIERLKGQVVRFQFQLAKRSGRPAESLPQHLAIIEAVCRGDAIAASASMEEHLLSVMDTIQDIGD